MVTTYCNSHFEKCDSLLADKVDKVLFLSPLWLDRPWPFFQRCGQRNGSLSRVYLAIETGVRCFVVQVVSTDLMMLEYESVTACAKAKALKHSIRQKNDNNLLRHLKITSWKEVDFLKYGGI